MMRPPGETDGVDPSLFYTGLIAELYAPLRSTTTTAEPYARFIGASGEPALELGCGDGQPLLDLRARGLDIEGLDSSADMLNRCRRAAAERGLDVVLHHQTMQSMDLGRRFRSIFLAGPTFNLLPDDETATAALTAIREHLDVGGSALIPLFVPNETPLDLGQPREAQDPDGTLLRVSALVHERDEVARLQTTTLRYERVRDGTTTVVDRPWVLHWHTQTGFRELTDSAGLETRAVLDAEGGRATDTADVFVFLLTAPAAPTG
jgi:SAM-dependent methyltransferase